MLELQIWNKNGRPLLLCSNVGFKLLLIVIDTEFSFSLFKQVCFSIQISGFQPFWVAGPSRKIWTIGGPYLYYISHLYQIVTNSDFLHGAIYWDIYTSYSRHNMRGLGSSQRPPCPCSHANIEAYLFNKYYRVFVKFW